MQTLSSFIQYACINAIGCIVCVASVQMHRRTFVETRQCIHQRLHMQRENVKQVQ